MDWFNIISFQNIVIFILGFIVGRFWKLGKKIINQIKNEDGE